MDDLHASFSAALELLLPSLALPHTGIALDLASGTGQKRALLRAVLGHQVTILALDCDPQAIMDSQQTGQYDMLWHCIADGHALPLADSAIDIVFCLAALGLFRDQSQVLGEIRRVLKPQAALFISVTELRWCERICWPADLMQVLQEAYQPQRLPWEQTLAASPDLSADLSALLARAGFASAHTRAFLVESSNPQQAELALLPWHRLRPLVAARLTPEHYLRCEAYAASPELELCSVVLLAYAK